MKAIVCEKNGPAKNLRLTETEKPVPKDNEVLIKIHAGTVTIGDVLMRRAGFFLRLLLAVMGFGKKKIPGTELSGTVEAVGDDVKRFQPGDEVYGTTTGLPYGGNAEYVCVPEEWKQGVLSLKPKNVNFEEAAAVPVGGMTALQFLRRGKIQKGQRILIYGASGSVGSYAVQLAKYFGSEVTGVCSAANLEMVRGLGADFTADYTAENFKTEFFTENAHSFDIVFDAVGKLPAKESKSLLKEGGTSLSIKSLTSEKNEFLDTLREIIEAGKLRPAIDRRFPLEQTAEAHRYVEQGHKKGNVVITVP